MESRSRQEGSSFLSWHSWGPKVSKGRSESLLIVSAGVKILLPARKKYQTKCYVNTIKPGKRISFAGLYYDQMPQSAVALRFFTRYVKQAGALPRASAVPWRLTTGA